MLPVLLPQISCFPLLLPSPPAMTAIVPLSKRPYDWLFLAYFALHLPISILVDLQIIFPRSWFPAVLRSTLDDWVRDADDVLTGTRPVFFQAFVWVELVFHIPYFCFALYAFAKGRNWIRDVSIIYATAVLLSMVAVIPESWDRSKAPLQTKLMLQSVLAIWCVLPLLLLQRVWSRNVFDYPVATGVAGKKKQ